MAVTATAIALKATTMKDTAQADAPCVHASIAQHTTRSREKADTNSVRTTIAKADTSSAKGATSPVHDIIVKVVTSPAKEAISSAKAAISPVKAAISSAKAVINLAHAITARVAISNAIAETDIHKTVGPREATAHVLQTIILMPSTA